MTDAELDYLESTCQPGGFRFVRGRTASDIIAFNELIAEVRRLRADNAVLSESVAAYMQTAMATNEQLNVVMSERDELRACLEIAMEVWSDLYEEHRGSRSPKIEDDEDWQRCRRAMVES